MENRSIVDELSARDLVKKQPDHLIENTQSRESLVQRHSQCFDISGQEKNDILSCDGETNVLQKYSCDSGANGDSNEDEQVFTEINESGSNERKTSVKKNRPPHVTFQISPVNDGDSTIQKEEKMVKVINSSEYVARASTMRAKIEEKITEIEEKIDLPASAYNSECLETESSPADYNLIKVLDSKRSRSCSVSEMKQNSIDRLQLKLEKAEKDLELREEEVLRLRKIRDEVGSEIEDLTASLFEEANNMVRNAHAKQQRAERSAKEANMKLGMLQEEVQALKEIVQSTKMYSAAVDNSEIQDSRATTSQRETYEIQIYGRWEGIEDPELVQCLIHAIEKRREFVDPIFNDEFVKWRQNPNLDKETPFMKRIYKEDIKACLYFKNAELSEHVLSAIEEDKITIEKIPVSKNEPLPKKCALMDAPRLCTYKMCLDGNNCFNISTLSRNRITAICDLFCYLRYIQKGLITLRIHEVYLEILKKRRRITSAKLGLVDDIIE